MNKGKETPEIRLGNFNENWMERKFSNIVNKVSKQSNDSNIPKVEFQDIISGEGRLNKDVSNKFDDRKGTIFQPGFILYGKLRPYLNNWLYPEFEGVALGDFWVFESVDSCSIFNYYLIQSERYQTVANISSGTKMPRSDWRTVAETVFLIPNRYEEQQKIGAFFKQLDDIITLQQQLLNDHKQLKKAMLQKMFPQKGESVPRVRFAGFTDDWKKERLGKIIVSHSFKKYISEPIENGKYPIIQQGNNSIVGYSNGAPFIGFEDVTLFGDHTLSLYKPTSPFLVSTDGLKIVSIDSFNGFFTYYLLEINNPESEGYKRHFKILKSKDVFYPDNSMEQAKIGNFLKQLDETIVLHEQKLETYQELKKAMLQKMFV